MWVWASGWIDEVMAMPSVKSTDRSSASAVTMASLLVRLRCPSRSDSAGRLPFAAS